MKNALIAGEIIPTPLVDPQNPFLHSFGRCLEQHIAFSKFLPLAAPFPSSKELAHEVWQSFVVECRARIADPKIQEVKLPHIGRIFYDNYKKGVIFTPEQELLDDTLQKKLKLKEFVMNCDFLKHTKESTRLWNELEKSLVEKRGFMGDDLLAIVARLILEALLRTDRKLKRSFAISKEGKFYYTENLVKLFEALCLTIHDSVCSGNAMEIRTLGIFADASIFLPDTVLTESAGARLARRGNGSNDFKTVRISKLVVLDDGDTKKP
ncbi:MAG: hypothetical protein HYT12_04815 [Candidatus Liptonbacteria bacterium]|nr:hypothetical protein [Candidatus Liptonbacteria bacterium]